MRAENRVPVTILDKWRRKAFELTNELVEMEQQQANELARFRAAESAISQRILDIRNKLAQTEKDNIKLDNERKCIESQISILERHSTAIDSQTETASVHYNRIVEVGMMHTNIQPPEVPKLEEEVNRLHEQISKLKTLIIPLPPSTWPKLETQVKELNGILKEKIHQSEEQKAAISIFRKLSAAQRKYHQLDVQMKGIEAEIEKENEERMREQKLRAQLVDMKDELKRRMNEKESELREVYEARKLERDRLIRQKKNLQIDIENTKSRTEMMEEEAKAELHEYAETVKRQNEDIEELRERARTMEAMLRFDKETNTEQERPRILEFEVPKKPPPVTMATPSAILSSGSSTASKLDALWAAAKEAIKDHPM